MIQHQQQHLSMGSTRVLDENKFYYLTPSKISYSGSGHTSLIPRIFGTMRKSAPPTQSLNHTVSQGTGRLIHSHHGGFSPAGNITIPPEPDMSPPPIPKRTTSLASKAGTASKVPNNFKELRRESSSLNPKRISIATSTFWEGHPDIFPYGKDRLETQSLWGNSNCGSSETVHTVWGDPPSIKKGILLVQREKLLSRWKERYCMVTRDYFNCFRRSSHHRSGVKLSEMGSFIFKLRLADIEDIEWESRRSGSTQIALVLPKEARILIRVLNDNYEALHQWYILLQECVYLSKERRRALRSQYIPNSTINTVASNLSKKSQGSPSNSSKSISNSDNERSLSSSAGGGTSGGGMDSTREINFSENKSRRSNILALTRREFTGEDDDLSLSLGRRLSTSLHYAPPPTEYDNDDFENLKRDAHLDDDDIEAEIEELFKNDNDTNDCCRPPLHSQSSQIPIPISVPPQPLPISIPPTTNFNSISSKKSKNRFSIALMERQGQGIGDDDENGSFFPVHHNSRREKSILTLNEFENNLRRQELKTLSSSTSAEFKKRPTSQDSPSSVLLQRVAAEKNSKINSSTYSKGSSSIFHNNSYSRSSIAIPISSGEDNHHSLGGGGGGGGGAILYRSPSLVPSTGNWLQRREILNSSLFGGLKLKKDVFSPSKNNSEIIFKKSK